MPAGSLRAVRDALIDDERLGHIEFGPVYAEAADEWLGALANDALGMSTGTWSLLAVGGYGRGHLAPFSDLDLVLVHDNTKGLADAAERLWYPVWDEGVGLDHSVRTPHEALAAARSDLRVALGLLDARSVAGDEHLAADLISRVHEAWRTELAARHLDGLEASMDERHARHGDLSFLLEPDLKEARGGLRDASALHALGDVADHLRAAVDLDGVGAAERNLRSIRVALQRVTRRRGDRLVLQEHDAVAASLGTATDEMLRSLSGSASRVASAIDVTWRRRARWDPSSTAQSAPPRTLDVDIVEIDGEASIASGAALDGETAMRLAVNAAREALPVAPDAAERIGRSLHQVPLERRGAAWTTTMTRSLVDTIREGTAGLVALETLDVADVLAALIPEWAAVRHFHQRNAYHRYTADRHLLEAACEASALLDTVIKPDVLLLGALFHDIGKGRGGDHTEIGVSLVGPLAGRLGLDDADVALLVEMVKLHLLLPDTAVRRDLADPATAASVAEAVGSLVLLELLAALAIADGRATGPSAWSAWKASQVATLVDRTRSVLVGDALEVPLASPAQLEAAHAAASSTMPVVVVGERVVIAARDRPGLLAAAAGVLCLAGLDVRSADARSIGPIAVDEFDVAPGPRGMPSADELSASLAEVLDGTKALGPAIEARARDYERRGATRSSVFATVDHIASARATVVEVRAPDRVGLLWRLADAITRAGLSVTAARAVSLGHEALDVFYVRTKAGEKVQGVALEGLLAGLAEAGSPAPLETPSN